MRHLGIDYGTKRVGLALSDEAGKIAYPEAVWPATSDLAARLATLARERGVGAVVMGESLNRQGEPNPVMARIERLKSELGVATGLPVHYEREWYSTAAARRAAAEDPHYDSAVDATAAAIILQTYLDRHVRT